MQKLTKIVMIALLIIISSSFAETLTNDDLKMFFEKINSKNIEVLKAENEKISSRLENKTLNPDLKVFFQALLNVSKALIAEDDGKNDLAVDYYKEAFWLIPAEHAIVAKFADEFKSSLKFKTMELPLDLEIETALGKKTTFANLLKGKKALLVDFWASWCGPCMSLMEELENKGKKLSPQGVSVAGLNTEFSKEKALKVKNDKKMTIPWLVLSEDLPYQTLLNVNSIPRMVLISPKGKVLFSGHPNDPGLNKALAKIGVKL